MRLTSDILNVFKKILLIHGLFLLLMTLFRVFFFYYYNTETDLEEYFRDILDAFILGMRIDLTVVGYIQLPITLILIAVYYIKSVAIINFMRAFFKYYLFVMYTIVLLFLLSDFAFYSYFKEHINILYFGLFDDDTKALLVTMWENYNVIGLLSLLIIALGGIYWSISKIMNFQDKTVFFSLSFRVSIGIFLGMIALNVLVIRGTLGMYPLGKMIPNVSENRFINTLPQNGVRAFVSAYKVKQKFSKNKYDLMKQTGFDTNIEKAFKIHTHKNSINTADLLENIRYTTSLKEEAQKYNVVVLMVESFGMPILKYQSEQFDILGELKKHFDEDILLTNMISAGNGTISSLEALLLNNTHRPGSFPLSQSHYKQTSFEYSPAFLYKKAGYETFFIYGGDLTWRDLGNFVSYQGYDKIEGKQTIASHLEQQKKGESEYFHPWGIFDEYLYSDILKKLEQSDTKQFIFALSTNNHPPYNIPNGYKSKIKEYSEDLKNHISGNFDLAQQRFRSYAYALDQVGIFLNQLKKSKFKDNTIVVVTADNNTIDGIMKYDENHLFNSKNIPLYFYLPKTLHEQLEIDTTVTGSHKDIFPTLYNLTLSNTHYIAIGNNLFDKDIIHYGFNGSMVVSSKEGVKRFKNFDQKDAMLEYYKATLAVQEYLLQQYMKKNEK